MDFKSKLYIKASKAKIVARIVFYVLVIIFLLGTITKLLFEDLSVNTVCSLVVVIVGTGLIRKKGYFRDHYTYCSAHLKCGEEKMSISYSDGHDNIYSIYFNYNDIDILEYSDQLECIRMKGTFKSESRGQSNITTGEHLLYILDTDKMPIIEMISNHGGISVTYMDR